jgi:hypothetical protein
MKRITDEVGPHAEIVRLHDVLKTVSLPEPVPEGNGDGDPLTRPY